MNVLAHERHEHEPTMTTTLKNALLIHNPNAGNGGKGRRRTLDTARHIFASRGIESELAETTGPGHATEIARRAASEGRGLVIACGGRATLNEVIHGPAVNQDLPRAPPGLRPRRAPHTLAKASALPRASS